MPTAGYLVLVDLLKLFTGSVMMMMQDWLLTVTLLVTVLTLQQPTLLEL